MAAASDDILNLLLGDLAKGPIEDSWPYALSKNLPHNDVVGGIKKLDNDEYSVSKVIEVSFYELTKEGLSCITSYFCKQCKCLVLQVYAVRPPQAVL